MSKPDDAQLPPFAPGTTASQPGADGDFGTSLIGAECLPYLLPVLPGQETGAEMDGSRSPAPTEEDVPASEPGCRFAFLP